MLDDEYNLKTSVQVHFCLEAMGRMVLDVGDEPRLGSVMKLTGNFFIVSFIEIIAEGRASALACRLLRDQQPCCGMHAASHGMQLALQQHQSFDHSMIWAPAARDYA